MWAAARPQENTTNMVYLQDSKAIVDKVIIVYYFHHNLCLCRSSLFL